MVHLSLTQPARTAVVICGIGKYFTVLHCYEDLRTNLFHYSEQTLLWTKGHHFVISNNCINMIYCNLVLLLRMKKCHIKLSACIYIYIHMCTRTLIPHHMVQGRLGLEKTRFLCFSNNIIYLYRFDLQYGYTWKIRNPSTFTMFKQ